MDELERDDDTNTLIRTWARSKEFSEQELARMAMKICRHGTQVASASHTHYWAIVGLVTAAALASLLIGGNVFCPQRAVVDAELMKASDAPWARMQVLADESDRLFDRRVAWLAETNQELLLGLDSSQAAAEQGGPQIAIRVVVFHRDAGQVVWKPIFTTNIVTREDEVVQMQAPNKGPCLRLWAHILPDQAVAVDSDLSLGSTSQHWWTMSVLTAGGSSAVATRRDLQGEYQVWQSAAVLHDNTQEGSFGL